jgi:hypothetical protein
MKHEPLAVIPGIGSQDVATIQSLLEGAGYPCHVQWGVGECGQDFILIRESDVPAIREFLAEYRLRDFSGTEYPIPW